MQLPKTDHEIDTSGLLCPMPVVKTKLALEDMAPGQVARVVSTDPGSKKDFPAWCNATGNKLLLAQEDKGAFIFFIERGFLEGA